MMNAAARRVCQLYSVGNGAINYPNAGVLWGSGSENTMAGQKSGGMNRKVTFAGGRIGNVAESSCLGPSPQLHPINYSISPNNHCVNHNYTEPPLVLAMKTPAGPGLQSRLPLYTARRRGIPAPRQDRHPAARWARCRM